MWEGKHLVVPNASLCWRHATCMPMLSFVFPHHWPLGLKSLPCHLPSQPGGCALLTVSGCHGTAPFLSQWILAPDSHHDKGVTQRISKTRDEMEENKVWRQLCHAFWISQAWTVNTSISWMNRHHFKGILHNGASNSKLVTVGRKKKQN